MADRDGVAAAGPTYLPALRWRSLTPLFDAVVRVTTRERAFKRRLLDQAAVAAGDSVFDLGAGTGTLAISLKQRCPGASVTGLDADPDVLARARRKAAQSGCEDLAFVEGFSTALPFADAHFDVVLSTLFFHHLSEDDKARTAMEIARVLKPGGALHVADYGKPATPLMRGLFLPVRAFDGFDVTDANARGALPTLFEQGGLEYGELRRQLPTPIGTLALYSAHKGY